MDKIGEFWTKSEIVLCHIIKQTMGAKIQGRFEGKLDTDSGRVRMPQQLVNRLRTLYAQCSEDTVTLGEYMISHSTTKSEQCLIIWPKVEWEATLEHLQGEDEIAGIFDTARKQIVRKFNNISRELDIDKTGRFTLPKNLIASVSLNKEIVFVGMGNRIEIWDKAYYDELQMTENDLDLDELLNPTKNNTTKEE